MLGSIVPLQVHGQGLDEVILGGAEGDGEGHVIHLLHHGGIAVGVLVAVAHALAVHAVEAHGVVEPHAVLSGEGLAVRPLHALAQGDGVDGGVLADGVALGHVGLHRAAGGEAEQTFLNDLARVPVAAAGGALQLAAIGADGQVIGVLHHHVARHGQTVGHVAINPLLGQEGGLGKGGGGFRQRRGAAQAQHQRQGQRHPLCEDTHVLPPVLRGLFRCSGIRCFNHSRFLPGCNASFAFFRKQTSHILLFVF